MTIPIKRFVTLFPALAVCLTTSCSKLTRGDAERALNDKYASERQYAYIQTGHDDHDGPKGYVRVRSGQWKTNAKETAALSDAGLVKVDVVATGVPMTSIFFQGTVDHIVVTPTEKGRPFLAGTFPPGRNGVCNDGCLRFVTATPKISIVGVGEPADMFGRKVSMVTFEVSWANTPVGDVLGHRSGSERREAAFIKFDNGWRLEK